MDLADIRKKARVQSGEVVKQELHSGTDQIPEVSAVKEEVWSDLEQFATEEEYTQGLLEQEEQDGVEQVRWLGFYLGQEEYALELDVVAELIKPRSLTELPQVPGYLLGIISLRGEVIPVIDLKKRLGLKSDPDAEVGLQRIVVCDGKEQRIGLLVDRVSQIVKISIQEIEHPQLVGDDPAAAYIQGVGRIQDRMLIQLRQEKALAIGAELE